MRPIALGRKNHLFAGLGRGRTILSHPRASLIESCKMNDVDPQAWLADVLDKIANRASHAAKSDELLPWTYINNGGKAPSGLRTPLTIACGDGAVEILQVQHASRSIMSGRELVRGARLAPGVIFERSHGPSLSSRL